MGVRYGTEIDNVGWFATTQIPSRFYKKIKPIPDISLKIPIMFLELFFVNDKKILFFLSTRNGSLTYLVYFKAFDKRRSLSFVFFYNIGTISGVIFLNVCSKS